MEVFVNGAPRELSPGASIATLLSDLNLDVRHVAVECNLELVPRAQHSAHTLQPGDRLEVVTLVGGG